MMISCSTCLALNRSVLLGLLRMLNEGCESSREEGLHYSTMNMPWNADECVLQDS